MHMFQARVFSPARARFAATAATVFALVALGGVTALPAAAATLTLTVTDDSTGAPYASSFVTLTPSGGGAPLTYGTDAAGLLELTDGSLPDEFYTIASTDSTYFADSTAHFIGDGTVLDLHIDKYKVQGTVPAGAGSGNTTIAVEFNNGGTWQDAGTDTVSSPSDTFELRLPNGVGDYRLVFHPSDALDYLETTSAVFTIDGSAASVDLGPVSFDAAATIRGTITDYPGGAPLSGATVDAFTGAAVVASTFAAADGTYALKFPIADRTVTVQGSAPGYKPQFYQASFFDFSGTPVTLDAGNGYAASGISAALPLDPPDATFYTVGGGGASYPVDAVLYQRDNGTGLFSQTPWSQFVSSSPITFTDLPDGDYRIQFRDSSSNQPVVWHSFTTGGAPVSASAVTGDCYIGFSVDSSVGDLSYYDVALSIENTYPATCTNPAYADASDAAVSGTVTNITDLSHIAYAKLYKANGLAGGTLVDISQVDSYSGYFSLTGVRDAGDYYIKISTYPGEPFLETLVGDGGYTAWPKDYQAEVDFGTDHSFAVDPTDNATLTGHDVTLESGAVLSGSLSNDHGDRIVGGVLLTNVADVLDTIYVQTDYNGSFSITMPATGTYTMLAGSLMGDYVEEYWEDGLSVADAEEIGPLTAGQFGTYDFVLAPAAASLYGMFNDPTMTDPITVHLYYQDDYGNWDEFDVQDSDMWQVYFTKNYDTGDSDGLLDGDYRMRFQDSSGTWLAAVNYATGVLPAGTTGTMAGPACYVDITGVTDGFPSLIEANFDAANQTEVCEEEPPNDGDVTGHVVSSVATGSENVAGQTVYLNDGYNFRFFQTTTDSNGEFTFDDVPNGDYQLLIAPAFNHTDGEHEYLLVADYSFVGGSDLGDVIPERFGNVSGTISNWDDDTMSGQALVYESGACGCGGGPGWNPVGFMVPIDSDGHFEVPGIIEDGDYSVWIDFDDTYVDTFVGGGMLEPLDPFAGDAEQDYTYPSPIVVDLEELVSITGTVAYGAYPLEYAEIYAEIDGVDFYFEAESNEDGTYEILVAPNHDYLISAYYDPLLLQYWEGYNYEDSYGGPFTGTALSVDEDAVGDIDFSLIAPQEDEFYVYTGTDAGGGGTYSFAGVDVHLYQYFVDGWEEVGFDVSTPYADIVSSGGGDYRLRFSKDGDWLRIEQTQWDIYLPPYLESDGMVEVDACYLEFSDLDHGSQVSVDAILDPDGVASGCSDEVLADHRTVSGVLTQTALFGNAPIEGQTVTLTNTATSAVQTTTTDAFGFYAFPHSSLGDYVLDIPAMQTTNGSYYAATGGPVEVDDNEDLGAIELTRYGIAEVQIDNWNPVMAAATAQLYLKSTDVGGDHWTAIGFEDTVDSTGLFEIPAISQAGDYAIWIDYPAGFRSGFIDAGTASPVASATFYEDAEYDHTGLLAIAYTTVSGTVRVGTTPVSGAVVEIDDSHGGLWTTTTAANGTYSIGVPADIAGQVEASKAGLVRDLDTAFVVGLAPVTNVDFELHYATFLSIVYATPTTPLSSASVHLYHQVSGGWQEVDTETGTATLLTADLSGTYRIRVSDGATWLALSDYLWVNSDDPSENSGGPVSPVPNVCYLDFAPASAGGEYIFQAIAVTAPSDVYCAAEPAVVGPPTTPGTSGSGKPKPTTTTDEEAVEVESTSTPTPSPTPSETETDAPDDAAGVDEPATASTPDFTWAFWAAGILALLVLAGGAVYFVRRRP